jgi:hypothetical protein
VGNYRTTPLGAAVTRALALVVRKQNGKKNLQAILFANSSVFPISFLLFVLAQFWVTFQAGTERDALSMIA